jgi:hypothetical protein
MASEIANSQLLTDRGQEVITIMDDYGNPKTAGQAKRAALQKQNNITTF